MTAAGPTNASPIDTTRSRGIPSGESGPPALAVCGRAQAPELARLSDVLAEPLPERIPARPRILSRRLREDDDLARRVWSHPTFSALVDWATRYHPAASDAWEDMAVYALARARYYQAGRLSAAEIRTGMVNTARWVARRGRHGERLDSLGHPGPLSDVVAPPLVPAPDDRTDQNAGAARQHLDVGGYLAAVWGRDLPPLSAAVIDETWQIARDHYSWLIDVTGLRGKPLVAAAQARNDVNRSRRLLNRLPRDWPPATRKAAALLFTGSPSAGEGLLAWWATTAPGDIPPDIRSRWSGLLAVIDPEVGTLPEEARRRHREHARRWTPGPGRDTPCIAV